MILGLLLLLFLKKEANFDVGFLQIIYFLYLLIVFERFSYGKQNTKERGVTEEIKAGSEDSLQEINEHKSHSHYTNFSTKKVSSIRKPIEIADRKTIIQNLFINEQETTNIINILNFGIIVVDENLEVVFANTCLFDFFCTKNLNETKNIFFEIEENLEINKSDFHNIPETTLKSIFQKSLYLAESFGSGRIDEISENYESRKTLNSITKYHSNFRTILDHEYDFKYEEWNKKNLTENISERSLPFVKKKKKPKTVLKYLKKIMQYCQKNGGFLNTPSKRKMKNDPYSSINLPNIKKYDMYAVLNIKNKNNFINQCPILIQFFPIKKEDCHYNLKSSYEIMITIRKLSDFEMKSYEESKSKNKILSSFCHELRTPLNALINMLDLMQTQMEESPMLSNIHYDILHDHLASANISSQLLLNQIDDFIEYFSYCNQIFEINANQFDLSSLFREVFKIFSQVSKKKNISLSIDIQKDVPSLIYNDQQKLKQILFNLLSKNYFWKAFQIIKKNKKKIPIVASYYQYLRIKIKQKQKRF